MESQGQKEKRSIPDQFRDAWSHALAAVSSAEDEAQKALSRVSDLAGWGPEEVRRHAREFAERLSGQRREIEKNIDQGVKKALSRVKLPRREEIESLQKRVQALTAKVDALATKRGSR